MTAMNEIFIKGLHIMNDSLNRKEKVKIVRDKRVAQRKKGLPDTV